MSQLPLESVEDIEGAIISASLRKRVILFVFDAGTGIGHLRRVSCIAKSLQRHFACLIITGHREITNWFISRDCEYVHVPAWESLLSDKAKYWGRVPFLSLPLKEAILLRKKILRGIVEAYSPDLIIVDHLPLGAHEELEDIISETPSVKYLVTRGVLNHSGGLFDLVLGEKATEYLSLHYDRIIVAADERVIDFAKEYSLPEELARKTKHVGYVIDQICVDDLIEFRTTRRTDKESPWIVVSAGGGQLGESLIEYSIEMSRSYPDVQFDIIFGPRSNLLGNTSKVRNLGKNVCVQLESSKMPLLNASADIVICSGGYNTLLEALQGNARIICVPNWKDPRDEQTFHAKCLGKFAEISIVPEVHDLGDALAATLRLPMVQDARGQLNLSGAAIIEQLALKDLR